MKRFEGVQKKRVGVGQAESEISVLLFRTEFVGEAEIFGARTN